MLTFKRSALLKRIFWSPSFVPDTSTGLLCSICNKVVDLEDAKTDESGAAVHGECYVLRLQQVANKEKLREHTKRAFPLESSEIQIANLF